MAAGALVGGSDEDIFLEGVWRPFWLRNEETRSEGAGEAWELDFDQHTFLEDRRGLYHM